MSAKSLKVSKLEYTFILTTIFTLVCTVNSDIAQGPNSTYQTDDLSFSISTEPTMATIISSIPSENTTFSETTSEPGDLPSTKSDNFDPSPSSSAQPISPFSELPVVNVYNDNSAKPYVKSSGPRCDPVKIEFGNKSVSCRLYLTIPTDIPNPDTITVLDLHRDNNITTMTSGQLTRSRLTRISILILKNCQIRVIEPGAFADANFLSDLDLSSNRIEILDPQVFSELVNLRSLNLQNNPIKRFTESTIFPPLQRLTYLDLSSCFFHRLPINVFGNLTNVETIYLNGNYFRHLNWRVFQNLTQLKNISFEDNPWHCDCLVKFLIDFFRGNMPQAIFQQGRCTTTANCSSLFIGAMWDAVPENEMTCPPKIFKLMLSVESNTKIDDANDLKAELAKSIMIGEDVYLECVYTGYPHPEVRWRKNNREMLMGNNSSEKSIRFQINQHTEYDEDNDCFKTNQRLMLTGVQENDVGMYTCIVETDVGDHDEKSVFLEVNSALNGLVDKARDLGITTVHTLWIIITLTGAQVLVSICLLTCCICWVVRSRRRKGFREVNHELYKSSNVVFGNFDLGNVPLTCHQSADSNHWNGAAPILN